MTIITKHKFHLVNRSQLPFLASGFAMLFASNVVFYLHPQRNIFLNNWDNFILHISIISINVIAISWFIMIIFESGQGFHTLLVQKGLRFGFWLFLVSEAMLFFSFFWGYFHFSLNPSISMGHQWPAELGIQHIDPYKIPLLNTILLLSSGATATLAHRAILTTDFIWNTLRQLFFFITLMITVVLGYIFLSCQGIEYCYGLQQSWMSNVYWSIFFMLTGFHGVHVIIGTVFLQFNYFRQYFCNRNICLMTTILIIIAIFYSSYWKLHIAIYNKLTKSPITLQIKAKKRINHGLIKMNSNISSLFVKYPGGSLDTSYLVLPQMSRYVALPSQHLGLEAALYYWHFVDAVWILLYMIVYLWGC